MEENNRATLSIESASVSLPRERFWDIQVTKIDSPTRQPLCPGRPAYVPLRHTIASCSGLAPQHSLKWLDGVSDVILDPLWRSRTTGIQNYLRLPRTTSPRIRSPWLAADDSESIPGYVTAHLDPGRAKAAFLSREPRSPKIWV